MKNERCRVVALGGCGGMGQFAVRTAIDFEFVDEICIADLEEQRARRFAEQCGPKARAIGIDVTDTEALIKLFRNADVVLATVGPYYRFGVPILRAAIQAGCHYLDINDDWEPTMEMLDLDDEAKQAGITAVIGMGASPGVSNLLAIKAVQDLDSVDDLITGWGTGGLEGDFDKPGEGGTYRAATEHWIQQLTGKIRVWRDAEFRDVPPFEPLKIDYPGVGVVKTHTLGHPEPVTLCRFVKNLRNSVNVMDMPLAVTKLLGWLIGEVNAGRLSVSEATDQLSLLEGSSKSLISTPIGRRALLGYLQGLIQKKIYLPSLFAYATGMKAGKRARVGVSLSGHTYGGMQRENMGGATGVPLAVGLALLAKGAIKQAGVMSPEQAIDADVFFDALAPFCTPQRADAKELVKIDVAF
jgi:saccharopine dehydrogenase-like NADP-dependent oxidoreductase